MQFVKQLAIGSITALLLAACGGSGDPLGTQSANPARGQLMQNPPPRIIAVSAAEFKGSLAASESGKDLLKLASDPVCGVDVNYIKYGTVGGKGEATNASAALMVPTGSDARCSGPRPIVLYAHGTTIEKRYNLADWIDRTNPAFSESTMLAALYAAQGYIVVAPNYAGYDSSTLDYHPYLNADQQSKEMMDALKAAQAALPGLLSLTTASAKLFVTGYSQGGHVAMATHKALQAANIQVTASAPMSGPYALAAQSDATFLGQVNAGSTIFTPMIITSAQKTYGNIYSTPGDFYESAYATGIESLLPGPYNWTTIFSKLPQTALFSSTAPTGMGAITPPTGNGASDALFASGFGTANLIKNSARASYVADAMANPDGAIAGTTLQPATNPLSPLRIAAKANDLRGWTPTSPVLLCGGNGDPTVFYAVHTRVMKTLWTGLGPLITELDVDSAASGSDPFQAVKAGFASAKTATGTAAYSAAVAAGKGANDAAAAAATAVVGSYHGTLVPPFCNVAARAFFSQF